MQVQELDLTTCEDDVCMGLGDDEGLPLCDLAGVEGRVDGQGSGRRGFRATVSTVEALTTCAYRARDAVGPRIWTRPGRGLGRCEAAGLHRMPTTPDPELGSRVEKKRSFEVGHADALFKAA